MSNVNTENNNNVAQTVVPEEKATKKKEKKIHTKPKWKRVLIPCIALLLVVVLVVVLLSVAFGNPDELTFSEDSLVISNPQSIDTSKGIKGKLLSDAGMTEFADNGKLCLQYSPKDDLFVVIEKKTGQVFRSYPEPIYEDDDNISSDLQNYNTNQETGKIISSPIFIGYSKSGLDGGFVKGINQMKDVTKNVHFIKDGIQIVYEIGELALSLTLEITVEDSIVKYKVPRNGIVERETAAWEEEDRRPLLTSLAILPYFGAHRQGDSGYFVSPDGSGALTYFNVPRVNNYNEYSKRVYGIDPTFDVLSNPDYAGENLSVGAYGIVDGNYMITSFIHIGESVASLKIGNPGVRNLPFYSIYYEYTYRYFYKQQVSKSGTSYNMVVKDMQIGDVEQHLHFDIDAEFKDDSEEGTSAFSYYDVAVKTRELMQDKWASLWNVKKDALQGDPSALNVRFFMGAETISGGVLDEMKVMTDFDEVKEIVEKLEKKGVTDLDLTLLGWTEGGYFWNSTTKNKVDDSFGGKSGLKKLTKWAETKKLNLSLDNNLLVIYGSPNGWSGATLRNSVVRQANSFYLGHQTTTISGNFKFDGYWMSPKYFEKELLKGSISRLKSYNTNGVTLQQLGNMVFSDYNEENAMLRVQAVGRYVNWLKQYKEAFDHVSVYYGYDYAVAVADTIVGIPMSRSSHIIFDETIPFMQIVYHGMVNYYVDPINNQDSPQYALLKAIEYGASLSYEVTEAETNELQYTDYLSLFKAQYSLLEKEICEAYRAAEDAIKPFIGQQITSHNKVDQHKEIFCTEYSEGGKVYVNYTDTDYTLTDGSVVKAMGYLVVNS